MNPSLTPEIVEAARAEDPTAAAAEWDAEFRADLEPLFSRDAVLACVVPGRVELPPGGRARRVAFVDPSGGSADSFTLAIAHKEGDSGVAVIDVLCEVRPPFSPDAVVAEYADVCRAYGVHRVIGDRYAGAWVPERFQAHGLRYEPSALSKSELFVALLGQVNSRRVELPDHAKLVAQLVGLERRTSRGTGRDTVDHPPGAHDDLANVVAGAVHLLLATRPRPIVALDGDFAPLLPDWWPREWPREWYGTGRGTYWD
jgi:hypothetical protein